MIFAKSRLFTRKKRIALLKQIPTDETRKAIRDCAKGKGKAYKNFTLYMQSLR